MLLIDSTVQYGVLYVIEIRLIYITFVPPYSKIAIKVNNISHSRQLTFSRTLTSGDNVGLFDKLLILESCSIFKSILASVFLPIFVK